MYLTGSGHLRDGLPQTVIMEFWTGSSIRPTLNPVIVYQNYNSKLTHPLSYPKFVVVDMLSWPGYMIFTVLRPYSTTRLPAWVWLLLSE